MHPYRWVHCCWFLGLVVIATESSAQCEDSDFLRIATRERSAELDVTNPISSVPERGTTVTIPLADVAIGDGNIMADSGSLVTTSRTEVNAWVWQAFVDTRDWLSPEEIFVSYAVTGVTTGDGLLVSDDGTSTVRAQVITRGDLDVIRFGRRITRFRAFVDVLIDFATATRAGSYSGLVTVNVECR